MAHLQGTEARALQQIECEKSYVSACHSNDDGLVTFYEPKFSEWPLATSAWADMWDNPQGRWMCLKPHQIFEEIGRSVSVN